MIKIQLIFDSLQHQAVQIHVAKDSLIAGKFQPFIKSIVAIKNVKLKEIVATIIIDVIKFLRNL